MSVPERYDSTNDGDVGRHRHFNPIAQRIVNHRKGNSLTEIAEISESVPWMARGACVGSGDPDAWFPNIGARSAENRLAMQVCRRCPVRLACLAYALTPPYPLGVWGGTTERERRALLKNQHPEGLSA